LAIGDGALGLWAALRDVFPETRTQRDWVHKTSNVLNSLPKSVHRRAKGVIKAITGAKNKIEAKKSIESFAVEFKGKWPKAGFEDNRRPRGSTDLLRVSGRTLAASEDYQPVESIFAPVRASTNLTKGPGSRAARLALIYKLIEAAEGRWRKLTGSRPVHW
jgi:putative transposase